MSRTRSHMLVLALFAASPIQAAEQCQATSAAHKLPLIELYTAEGCNKCPPVDRWLSKRSKETDPSRAAMLAFHVDYWDAIGWKDRFADPRYGQRQDLRVKLAQQNVIYTPQLMVGSDVMVKWQDEKKFEALLDQVHATPASIALAMQASAHQDKVHVKLSASRVADATDGAEPVRVWLALYEDGLSSRIKDGENKGLTLHHDRVVRVLEGPWPVEAKPLLGEVEIPLSAQADSAKQGLVLFAESGKTGEGLQALNLPFATCVL